MAPETAYDGTLTNTMFRLDGGQVILSLPNGEQVLGPQADVCRSMEAFLAQLSHNFVPRFGGLTFGEWDARWRPEGRLAQDFGRLRKQVGLYKAKHEGRIMYIGKATEHANGGLRKRLHDYSRLSASSRGSFGGRKMYEHREELEIEILVTGEGRAGSQIATCLEDLFVERYEPIWNRAGTR